MAMETTSQILFDGGKSAVVQLTGYSADGSGEDKAVKVEVKTLTPPCSKVALTKIDYNVNGGAIKLSWTGLSGDDDFLILTGQGCLDYEKFGGMASANPSDIVLSTIDWKPMSAYSLMLAMDKKAGA